ncbi:MAG: hypothetical protein LC620_08280 [Halobacteriales archaeon]|nr:hypothetical protein [Halobacteriales archaeon]
MTVDWIRVNRNLMRGTLQFLYCEDAILRVDPDHGEVSRPSRGLVDFDHLRQESVHRNGDRFLAAGKELLVDFDREWSISTASSSTRRMSVVHFD